MSCLINTGYQLPCRDNIGGIRKVFIGTVVPDEDKTYYTLNADKTEILSTTSTIEYYTFEQEMETGSFSQNGNYSIENGTIFFDQQLALTFYQNDTALRNQLLILSQANLRVIIEDQRGNFWLMGFENGVRAVAGTMSTGKAYGDLNGITITLQGREQYPAYRIDATDVMNLRAADGADFDIKLLTD